MFTVRLEKYAETKPGYPTATEVYSIREAKTVHVRYENNRAVLQLNDAPGEDTTEITVGSLAADCSYNVAYIMNEQGKTVDTIR